MTNRSISESAPRIPSAPPSKIVEPPTFLISARPHFSANLCVLCASALSFSFSAPDFQPSTFNFQPSFSPKSNYSRTSEQFACKSNHSRTYAKTGGWGCLPRNARATNSFVFFRLVNYMIIYMSNHIVGAPTFSSCPRTEAARLGRTGPTKREEPRALMLRATPFPSILNARRYEAHLFGSQRYYRR
jgi:hypothetical protein